jgi:hypothetical protein
MPEYVLDFPEPSELITKKISLLQLPAKTDVVRVNYGSRQNHNKVAGGSTALDTLKITRCKKPSAEDKRKHICPT